MSRLSTCAAAIRQRIPRGDSTTIERLIAIVRDEARSYLPCSRALVLACELADDRGAQRLLGVAETILSTRIAWEDFPTTGEAQQAGWRRTRLIDAFVVGGVEHLLSVLEDHERVFQFLNSYYLQVHRFGVGPGKCARLMAACKVAPQVREDTIVAIIALGGGDRPRIVPGTFYSLVDCLGPTSFPALRKLVRSETALDRFHSLALHTLAYLGDREIEGDMEAHRLRLNKEHGWGDEVAKRLQWLIDARHNPKMHLEHIVGGNAPGHILSRVGSMRVAAQLGVDHKRIRNAILQYAKNRSGRSFDTYLKQEGIRLGILKESDLPDVQIPAEWERATP